MAYDDALADILREALAPVPGLSEKRMFGGLCFLVNGNMLCGVHRQGGMARVGKDREQEALHIQGVTPLSFTGRRMGGMVDVEAAVLRDPARRERILSLARAFVEALPPK